MFYHYFMEFFLLKHSFRWRIMWNLLSWGQKFKYNCIHGEKQVESVLTSEFNIFDLVFRSQGTDMNNQADAY